MDIFSYQFFINALIGIAIISIASAIIGTYIVTRRLVSISGGVTHACFGGLGLGYFLGISPVAMAALFAVGSSLLVETMSTRWRVREDSAIAVVWALGMAIGVIFVFMTPGYVPELTSFLFGNILTISHSDIVLFAVYTVALIAFFAIYFRKIVAVAFDRDFATISGLPVKFISTVMTVMIALCIVLTIKLVGVMLLMSMLSLPQMIAENFFSRLKSIMFASVVISLIGSVAGLMLSLVIDVPCSALIVAVFAVMYVISKVASVWLKKS
ncbi:MAG: metal ABC transporter permease [Muribaculaceae bacterium]